MIDPFSDRSIRILGILMMCLMFAASVGTICTFPWEQYSIPKEDAKNAREMASFAIDKAQEAILNCKNNAQELKLFQSKVNQIIPVDKIQ